MQDSWKANGLPKASDQKVEGLLTLSHTKQEEEEKIKVP